MSADPSFSFAFLAGAGVFYLIVFIVFLVAYWKIWSKAGFNGAKVTVRTDQSDKAACAKQAVEAMLRS